MNPKDIHAERYYRTALGPPARVATVNAAREVQGRPTILVEHIFPETINLVWLDKSGSDLFGTSKAMAELEDFWFKRYDKYYDEKRDEVYILIGWNKEGGMQIPPNSWRVNSNKIGCRFIKEDYLFKECEKIEDKQSKHTAVIKDAIQLMRDGISKLEGAIDDQQIGADC